MKKRRGTDHWEGIRTVAVLFCISLFLSVRGYGQDAPFKVLETGSGDFATLKGRVSFRGEKPAPRRFQAARDQAVCGSGEHLVEDVSLSAEGFLLDAVVEITGIEGPRPWPALPEGKSINQENCRFSPSVVVVPNEDNLAITNSDSVLHNINSGFFNLAQPLQGQKNNQLVKVDKRRQGKFIRLNCNIHDWMEAWLYVPNSPYYAVTSADSEFTIDQIPPGTYTVSVTHPFLGGKTYEVSFGKGETVELSPVFE